MRRRQDLYNKNARQTFHWILKGSLSNDSDVMCMSFCIIHSWILFVELKNQLLLMN